MTFECPNCKYTKELKQAKIKIDDKGNTKHDDSICDKCGSKMERTDEELDLNTTKMSKPFTDRGKNFYLRRNNRKL